MRRVRKKTDLTIFKDKVNVDVSNTKDALQKATTAIEPLRQN